MRRGSAFARRTVAGAALLVGLGSAVGVAAAQAPGGSGPAADFGLRAQSATTSATVTVARAQLRSELGTQGFVSTDQGTGAVRLAGRFDGFLTARSSAAPADIALGWVRDHLAALGLKASDLDNLKLTRDYRSIDGVTHLIWEQRVDGVPLVDADLRANVSDDGQLVNVGGGPRGGLTLTTTEPAIDARAAYASVLRSVGSSAAAPAIQRQSGALKTTDFAGDGAASLVAYAAGDEARLAWRTAVPAGATEDYDALVDAQTGQVVRRSNFVKFANALVHDNYPGSPAGGGTQVSKPITQWLAPGAVTLTGNNAHAFVDADDQVGSSYDVDRFVDRYEEAVPAAGEVGPSAGSDWLYAWTPFVYGAGICPAVVPNCTWRHTQANSWQINAKQATTQLFYFVNTWHDHLAAAPIGFDDASGNFQRVNASGQGKGGDPVLAQSDDGANTGLNAGGLPTGLPDGGHIDNANMDTRPDGLPGRMQMYLFEPAGAGNPFSAVNGSDDPQIVYHEYTHGLSNRLITDAQGYGQVDSNQAGAMGEAWSDWYALDYLNAQGLLPDPAGPGDVKEGIYVDGGNNLIRTQPVDCQPGDAAARCPGGFRTGPGGYTYGDFGKILGLANTYTLPEVHADGEIWSETLWQMRAGLIAAHGLADGSRRAEQIVTGGMRLSPAEPTYLDERNAILQADQVAGNGDAAIIWAAFAARGMGYYASTTGEQDDNPQEDFSLPPAAGSPVGVVTGSVRDDSGNPLSGVLVGLSGHDTPNAGPALQALSQTDGTYSIANVPSGTYLQLTANAPAGYADALGGQVDVGNGIVRRDFTIRRNYADVTATRVPAATIPGLDASGGANRNPPDPQWSNWRDETLNGCGPNRLFDGDLGTSAETSAPTDTDDPGTPFDETAARYITVKLAADVPAAEVWIDPTAHCGGLDGNALGNYQLGVSSDGLTWTIVSTAAFGGADLHHLNRVPINQGEAMPASIRYVRLYVLRSLGGPDEEGDPLSDGGFVMISDLEVYSHPTGGAQPVPTASPTPTPTPTPIPEPAAKYAPDLAKTGKRLKPSASGKVSVTVTCKLVSAGLGGTACKTKLTLTGKLPGKKKASTLATGTITVSPGKSVSVKLTLSKAARAALRHHSLKATLRAGSATRSVTLVKRG